MNPRNETEAREFVAYVESLFMPWNIDALVAGFTEDCTVRFGTLPEFRGQDALRRFFEARAGAQCDYRLKKEFRALSGDTIANVWTGWWQDRTSGAAMTGFGAEVWTMRGGKIAVWEAAFNTARADAAADLERLIRGG
ncbi:MAG TPA: nuclear transport factor 2 family protein [Acetobacteraceae bacterium]|nr:nuclear transport factor 2 family protein [Acetobacteraceae bacterium]